MATHTQLQYHNTARSRVQARCHLPPTNLSSWLVVTTMNHSHIYEDTKCATKNHTYLDSYIIVFLLHTFSNGLCLFHGYFFVSMKGTASARMPTHAVRFHTISCAPREARVSEAPLTTIAGRVDCPPPLTTKELRNTTGNLIHTNKMEIHYIRSIYF
jgi:hypothetical protein